MTASAASFPPEKHEMADVQAALEGIGQFIRAAEVKPGVRR